MIWKPVLQLNLPFDPQEFLGKKFTIAEQDSRSQALKEIDLNQVIFFGNCLSGEAHITGEEKRKRLLGMGCIPFNELAFIAFYREENQESLEWIHKKNPKFNRLDFLGTVFKNKKGRCFGLYLRRLDDAKPTLTSTLVSILQWIINLPFRLFGKRKEVPNDKWVWDFGALDLEWDSECYSGSIAPASPVSRPPPISRVHPKGLSGRVVKLDKPKGPISL
jgi:hypothetical protein